MALKYKIGDRVRIKGIDWYNENKDAFGNIRYKRDGSAYPVFFSKYMSNFCGEILTIKSVFKHSYHMNETSSCEFWTDEMIEGLVEEETKPKFKVGDKVKWYNHTCNITSIDTDENIYIYLIKHDDYREDKIFAKWAPESELTFEDEEETKPKYEDEVNGEYYSTPKYLVRPNGYRFVDENGNVINATKIVLEKKKNEYPKTYEECCRVLRFHYDHYLTYDDENDINPIKEEEEFIDLMDAFSRLIVCRDAYWKLYGEEMGLDGPWKPDYTEKTVKYCLRTNYCRIVQTRTSHDNHPFSFPTEEMRDAFYKNFKELIEQCKELL